MYLMEEQSKKTSWF